MSLISLPWLFLLFVAILTSLNGCSEAKTRAKSRTHEESAEKLYAHLKKDERQHVAKKEVSSGYIGCYIDNANRVINARWDLSNAHATVESCRTFCGGYTYFGLQAGYACFCGETYDTLGKAAESDCYSTCAYDSSEICGGPWRNSVYKVENSLGNYIGCYVDSANRVMNTKSDLTNTHASYEKCQSFCAGSKYFALQAGYACFCGDTYDTLGKAAETDCSTRCARNSVEICGGPWRNSVFSTKSTAPASYIGCYVDAANRAMTTKWDLGTTYSAVELCRSYCSCSTYFGLQNGYACFCAESYDVYGKAAESDCNIKCAKDSSQNCGGPWRNSVYTVKENGIVPKTPSATYIGCYVDSANRVITSKSDLSNTYSSVEQCQAFCAGFTYFGLQAGYACFCGESYDTQGKASESDCNTKCQNKPSQNCGGPWRNSVYKNGFDKLPSPSYIGCYADTGNRAISGKADLSNAYSTVELCQQFCQGYKYFGLQAGYACFCGNSYDTYGRAAESDCQYKCSKNGLQTCGGAWRNSVYSTQCGSAPPTTTTTTTTAPTTTTTTRPPPLPEKPQCTPRTKADITFLLDDSGSIGKDNYNNGLIAAVKGIVGIMLPGDGDQPADSRVACVLFDDKARLQWGFSQYTTPNQIVSAVKNLPYYGYTTNTADGFNTVLNQIQPTVKNNVHIVIVITDGVPSDGTDNPVAAAQKLKDAGAKVFAIGVGSQVDKDLLDKLASKSSYRADVADYANLKDQMKTLATIACQVAVGQW